jgi:hypothetical protein
MSKLPIVTLCLLLFSLTFVSAQHEHFAGFKWREKQSDHFTLRAKSTNHDPARKYAEKVWDECVRVMPGLTDDFAKNEFRTPGGSEGSDTAPYRFTVYLVGTGKDYTNILNEEQQRSGWDVNRLRTCRIARNFADPQNRYYVLCKADPARTGGGGERDLTPSFVHGCSTAILKGRSLSGNMPFWFTAGWGYYVEHRIFRLCRVYYLDFENYYKNNDNVEIKKGAVLGPEDAWTNALKKMCKQGIRETLDKISKVSILSLTPNQSGYMFALTYFLVSTDERIEKYRKLIAESRGGTKITKELLLEVYGYKDDAALEMDWYDFMESRDFR